MDTLFALVPPKYAMLLPALAGLAAFADAVIPQPRAGSRWVPVRKVVSALGANFGHAANAVKPGAATQA